MNQIEFLNNGLLFYDDKHNLKITFDSNYILNNFIKFATDYEGITLKSSVLIQAAGQIAIRETVAGFISAPFNVILEYFDEVYRLRKLGLSYRNSFKYAF